MNNKIILKFVLILCNILLSFNALLLLMESDHEDFEANNYNPCQDINDLISKKKKEMEERKRPPMILTRQLLMELSTFHNYVELEINRKFIIFIMSKPTNVQRRKYLNETWASPSMQREFNFQVIYFMGKKSVENVFPEDFNGKNFVISDFIEDYRNLTLKSLSMMEYVAQGVNLPRDLHLMKVDDDIVVDIERLINFKKLEPGSRYFRSGIVCKMHTRAIPIRNVTSKWYVSEAEYSGEYYPNYCSGAGYIFKPKVAKDILNTIALNVTNWLFLEDVFVSGILARNAKVRRRNLLEGYMSIYGCSKGYIMAHCPNERTFLNVWKWVQRTSFEDRKIPTIESHLSTFQAKMDMIKT